MPNIPTTNNSAPIASKDPTVLVKKADGTTVRVSLSELRGKKLPAVEQSTPRNAAPVPAATVRTTSPVSIPSRKVEDKPKITLAEAIAQITATPAIGNRTSDFSKLNGAPTPPKSDAEVRSPKSVDRSPTTWHPDDHKSLLDESLHKDDISRETEARRQALARVRPAPAIGLQQSDFSNRTEIDRGEVPARQSPDRSRRLAGGRSPIKPILHDVTPVAPPASFQSVGPVDELRQFTLTDFRRLAPSISAARSKLLDKFDTLKADSYLLYMEGVEAWQNSPLYRGYQDVLVESLTQKKPVAKILEENPQGLHFDELTTIIQVNKQLI